MGREEGGRGRGEGGRREGYVDFTGLLDKRVNEPSNDKGKEFV